MPHQRLIQPQSRPAKTSPIQVAAFIVGILAFALFVGALITWGAWLWIAVPVCHGFGWAAFPKIGFWTAMGLNVLWGILSAPFRQHGARRA